MSAGAGFVSLVGAGPGDPELLTLRAARRIGEADLVLWDALSAAGLPAWRKLAPRAHWFFVGKRARRASLDQRDIEGLMIRAARRGRCVVRLKGGDPFVLGRGGEEALALRAAGVDFEVVPGISSAVSAPALAGIPVTHRGLATGFLVVSGHAERAWRPVLGGLPPAGTTVVVLMGLASRGAIAASLRDRGWAGETPAAVVLAAGAPEQWRWIGTLDGLGSMEVPVERSDAPGVLVIGEVVSLAETIGEQRGNHVEAAAAAGEESRRAS